MGKFKDLTGQTFGKLTVIKRVEDQKAGRPMWLCQCECGNLTTVSSTRLSGLTAQGHVAVSNTSPPPP